MHNKVFEGTWDEVSKQAAALGRQTHVRLEVIESSPGRQIQFGMFPQLAGISEDDFAGAEWKPDGPSD